MFSVTTGEQTRVLQAHKANVVGISINPHNSLQLYSFGRDHRIYLWDYNDAIILSTFKVKITIEHFAFDPKRPGIVYLSAFGSRNKNGVTLPSYDIYEYSLTEKESQSGNHASNALITSNSAQSTNTNGSNPMKLLLQTKARNRSSFIVTPDGDFLIVQSKRHWKIFHIESHKTKKFNHRSNISCIAVHPKQHFVATGDDVGEIIFWYVFGNSALGDFESNSKNKINSSASSKSSSKKNGAMETDNSDNDDSEDESSSSEDSQEENNLHRHSQSKTTNMNSTRKPELVRRNSVSSRIRDDPVTTTVHWHAHRVGSISFDSTGSHMYSGGQEMVLVIWQLESGRKDFLPRLGAPIIGISHTPDETLLCIRCRDNTIKVINSRSRLLQVVVEGINLATPYLNPSSLQTTDQKAISAALRQHRRAQRLKTGLVVEPRNNAFVFNATEGQLQVYSPLEDKHISKIQVGTKNPVKTFQETHIAETQVTQVVFSANGQWMVTIDAREDQLGQSALKFWHWDHQTMQYELNTQYNLSKSEKIKSLAYHPLKDLVATAGTDGKFKLWNVKSTKFDNDENGSNINNTSKSGNPSNNHQKTKQPRVEINDASSNFIWTVGAVGKYRDLEAKVVAFSGDGSLMAIAHHHIITLWNPTSTMLLTTLTYPPDHEPISRLAFVQSGPFLVACSKRRLFVWDLLTCQLKWSHFISAEILTVDPKSSKFAIYSPINIQDYLAGIQQQSGNKPNSGQSNLNSSDPNSDSPQTSSKSQQKPRTDGYVILFSPDTPVPIGYWVMPAHGVRGLAFLPTIRSSRNSDHLPRTSGQSSLIYLNGQHEFKFLLTPDDQDQDLDISAASPSKKPKKMQNPLAVQQQFVAKINATKLAEGPSVFTLMYGSGLSNAPQEPPTTPSKPSSLVVLPKIVSQAKKQPLPKGGSSNASPQARQANTLTEQFLQGLFQGESHILPPPATLFPQFADAFIIKSTSKQSVPPSIEQPRQTNAAHQAKPDDFRYIVPKKIAAAKLAHAEISAEAKLLEAQLSKLSVSKPVSEYSYLDDFFSKSTPSSLEPTKNTEKQSAPQTPKSIAKSKTSIPKATPSKTPSKISQKGSDSPLTPASGTKKRKRSNSMNEIVE